MEKNYYEILEVDKKASNEIIEKAYKTLAKKYHPDLQSNEIQKEYEEKMKLINEAYSVLSDDYKKSTYDEQLQNNIVSIDDYKKVLQENAELKQEIQKLTGEQTQQTYTNRQYQEQINRAVNQAYQDAYVQDMKNRGYKIKYKHTFKQYRNLIISIAVVILIFILIWQIPFVKKFFVGIYEENIVIKSIVDIFINTFTTKF